MRILFISTMGGSPWGGSEELWSQAAIRLAANGHQLTVSVSYWAPLPSKVTSLAAKGIHVHRRLSFSFADRLRRKILPSEDLHWLIRQSPDLVVISQGSNMDGLEWMQHCQKANLRYAVILQANWEGWWPPDELVDKLAQSYSAAEKIYGVSIRNIELLRLQLAERLPNAEHVWNPINVSSDESLPWPSEQEGWKMACVGRLEPISKGQDILFQVLSSVKWRDRPLVVNLYGGGHGQQQLQKLAKFLHLNQVHFHGHVTDITKIWTDNHVLVLPSRYEGLPLALIEAMCCGRSAIVTNVGDNKKVCIDGQTGFVSASPTVELLDETMERAWAARHDWKILGQAARKRYEAMVPSDPIGQFCDKLLLAR